MRRHEARVSPMKTSVLQEFNYFIIITDTIQQQAARTFDNETTAISLLSFDYILQQ